MDSGSPRARIDQFFPSKKRRALSPKTVKESSPSAKGSLDSFLVTSQNDGSSIGQGGVEETCHWILMCLLIMKLINPFCRSKRFRGIWVHRVLFRELGLRPRVMVSELIESMVQTRLLTNGKRRSNGLSWISRPCFAVRSVQIPQWSKNQMNTKGMGVPRGLFKK